MAAFAVQMIGPAGRRALCESSRATILAVFHRSFYIANEAGQLCCFGPAEMGGGPLNALCGLPHELDWQSAGLRVGAGVDTHGGVLRLSGDIALHWVDALEWRPRGLHPGWHSADLARALPALAQARQTQCSSGLGPLLGAIACNRFDPQPAQSVLHPLLRPALAPLSALIQWLDAALGAEGQRAPPVEAAFLLGLGPGLTPAGDDFLGGMMIALHVLGHVDAADRLAAWALPLARERTHALSYAHLGAAAHGMGAEALHRMLVALCAGGNDFDSELRAIDAIGHSSGWDALTGAVAACCAVANRRQAGG